MPTTTISTTLLESVNIVLANIGESPVNALYGAAVPQQVGIALNTIEEVSTDIQSKGWWFNQQTSGGDYSTTENVVIYPSSADFDWSSSIPEEARRYITIRASRIAQARFIGSEELQKFSYPEELVSLAILQQAHVRNSNGTLDFNDFPEELKGLGIDEVMFLQGSVEDKLGTLRLGGELATIDKTKAETSLLADQEELVTKQALDVAADTELKTSQKTQLDIQTALEGTAEKDFFDNGGVSIDDSIKSYRDFAPEMRMMGIQEPTFQALPAYKKVELIKDADKLRDATATESTSSSYELTAVNKVMRLIGEPPVLTFNSSSLASECVRLMRDTDTELQGRGWWFNTEEDVELTPSADSTIDISTSILSLEVKDYDTRISSPQGGVFKLYDLKEKSDTWTSPVKAKVIYKREFYDLPIKYLEYLNVRVAILLTELYPQSGVDIQRLPKMEAELRAYFKDREFDQANYSIFDSYDVATRIGINRNYQI